jgi:hypothetical protein
MRTKKRMIVIALLTTFLFPSVAKAEMIYTYEYERSTGLYPVIETRDEENLLNSEHKTKVEYTKYDWNSGDSRIITNLILSVGTANPNYYQGSNTELKDYILLGNALDSNIQSINVGKNHIKKGVSSLGKEAKNYYNEVVSIMTNIKNSKYEDDDIAVTTIYKNIRKAVNDKKLTWEQVFIRYCRESYLPVFFELYFKKPFDETYWRNKGEVTLKDTNFYYARDELIVINPYYIIDTFGKLNYSYKVEDDKTLYYNSEQAGGVSKINVSGYDKKIIDVKTKIMDYKDYVYVKGLSKGNTTLTVKITTLSGNTASYKVKIQVTDKSKNDLRYVKTYSPLSYTNYTLKMGDLKHVLYPNTIDEIYIRHVDSITRGSIDDEERFYKFTSAKMAEEYIRIRTRSYNDSISKWGQLFEKDGVYAIPDSITKKFDRFLWMYDKLVEFRHSSKEYEANKYGDELMEKYGTYLFDKNIDGSDKTEAEIIKDYEFLATIAYQLADLEIRDIGNCTGVVRDGELCTWEIDSHGTMRLYNPQLTFGVEGIKKDTNTNLISISPEDAAKGVKINVTGDKLSFMKGYLVSTYRGTDKNGKSFSGRYAYEIKKGDTLTKRTIEFYLPNELEEDKYLKDVKEAVSKNKSKLVTVIRGYNTYSVPDDNLPKGVAYYDEYYVTSDYLVVETDGKVSKDNKIKGTINTKDCVADEKFFKIESGCNHLVLELQRYIGEVELFATDFSNKDESLHAKGDNLRLAISNGDLKDYDISITVGYSKVKYRKRGKDEFVAIGKGMTAYAKDTGLTGFVHLSTVEGELDLKKYLNLNSDGTITVTKNMPSSTGYYNNYVKLIKGSDNYYYSTEYDRAIVITATHKSTGKKLYTYAIYK